MGEFEAIGDAVTGGVVSRAVEPNAGEAADGHTHETNCLNCGALLAGPYCHECGQHAHVHRTLSAFFHDFLHGVVHFEGKIWRTLPLLVWKPGELTRRYIDGQRASFVSPIALFLFTAFLMFAVMSFVGGPDLSGARTEATAEQKQEIADQLRRLEARRAVDAAAGRPTAIHDAGIAELRARLRGPQEGEQDTGPGIVDIQTDRSMGWFDQAYRKAKQNPDLLLYKLQNNAYKISWTLIPISVPFVWLLFLHRRRYREFHAYDHTVFVTYSLSFMTLLVVAFTLLGRLLNSNDIIVFGITLIPPVHIYRQLRDAYRLSPLSALWRTVALSLFAMVCLTLFLLMLIGIGVM